MSADLLREAAAAIRADWQRDADYWEGRPPGTIRTANTWVAVADWLDDSAIAYEQVRLGSHPFVQHAIAVARAYLGRADA